MGHLRSIRYSLAVAVLAGLGSVAYSEDLPGADSILHPPATSQPVAAGAQTWQQQADALAKNVGTLAPEEAAKQWLAVFDAEAKRTDRDDDFSYRYREPGNDPMMAALPPPADWQAMATAIDARPLPDTQKNPAAGGRELALHALGHVLINDRKWLADHVDDLVKVAARHRDMLNMMRVYGQQQMSFKDMLLGAGQKPTEVVQDFKDRLDHPDEDERYLEVPDLVTLVGADQAKPLLERAVVSRAVLNISVGDQTRKLAQSIAKEKIGQLVTPQWMLVSIDTPDLYEAINKRFPDPTTQKSWLGLIGSGRERRDPHESERQTARQNYILGLVIAGRSEEAIKLIKAIPQDQPRNRFERGEGLMSADLAMLDRMGYTGKVFDTVDAMLREDPDLPIWPFYRSLAARTGNTDKLVELAKSSMDKTKSNAKREVQVNLALALLAADRLDEAAPVMQSILNGAEGTPQQQGDLALQWAKIGRLTGHADWNSAGLAIAAAQCDKIVPDDQSDYDSSSQQRNLIEEMVNSGHPADALRRMSKAMGVPRTRMNSYDNRYYLLDAITIYSQAGRSADVLQLLTDSPDWNASDLSELLTEQSQIEGAKPLGYMAAAALADTGKTDDARKILYALLNENANNDAAYALLLKIDSANLMAKLDEMYSRDHFEERPLIWKAEMLRQQGKLDEAEKVAHQAITVDPSDGETGHGDRMRVYAVLADILADKKDDEHAKFFRNVVGAIRMAEGADDLYAAGLLKRAVDQYQKSLDLFADAYCIQSRLALKLQELGLTQAAAEHYRRAYELMPDSFGRVESHCFGCEGAFRGEQAQSIAEKVFKAAAEKTPDKPQVHYLLGYLREEQDRYPEAADSFRQAVKLDPEYLNAWKHLMDAGEHAQLPQTDIDAAAFAILRLDPLHRHTSANFSEVRDLPGLWDAVSKANAVQAPPQQPVFTLTASKAVMSKQPADEVVTRSSSTQITPAQAVGSTAPVAALRQLTLPSME